MMSWFFGSTCKDGFYKGAQSLQTVKGHSPGRHYFAFCLRPSPTGNCDAHCKIICTDAQFDNAFTFLKKLKPDKKDLSIFLQAKASIPNYHIIYRVL